MTETPKTAPLKVDVKNFLDADQLRKDISYTLSDISGAQMTQASLFVHYGMIAAQAAKQVDDFKMLGEITEARIYRALRDKAVLNGEKLTEARLIADVSVNPSVITMRRALNEAKQIEANAKTASEGFRHRKDMLVQHGAKEREEMKGEVVTRRRLIEDNEVKAQGERYLARVKEKE